MNKPNFDVFLITSEELFNSLARYETEVQSEVLSFDLESDSEIEKIANAYGIGLAFTTQKAFYIPWRNKDGTLYWSTESGNRIINWVNSCLSKYHIIGHNIIYDALVYENNFKFTIDPYIYADTILMAHTINEDGPFALKEISPIILGPWADKAQELLKENVIANGGKWTEDQKDMYLADTHILGEYCCWDVLLTMMLFEHFNKKLQEEGLTDFFYKEEVMPLYKTTTINMKRKGFKVDVDYFRSLKAELDIEINRLEKEIMLDISPLTANFERDLLEKDYPAKPAGNFPKYIAELNDIPLPIDKKKGTVTLAKKALELQKEAYKDPYAALFYDWVISKEEIKPGSWLESQKVAAQKAWFFDDNPGKKQIFNLRSPAHLGHLLYVCLGIKPFKFTKKGNKPATDAEVMDELIEKYKEKELWMVKLYDYRKLNKLQGTYVEGILDRQIDGIIYTSMLQFGTISGRYASRNPNLQNQPRIKDEDSGLTELVLKYVNAIKKGFIAGEGYKVVNADYASLEPRCFAHMSGDEKLRDVFRKKNEDLYSLVGIETFGLVGFSSNKKDPNYLGEKNYEMRQKSKEFVLMVPYGAEEAQVSRKMEVSYQEAGEIIKNYLDSFPSLRRYMNQCNYNAKNYGFVKTELGRIRHLKEAKYIHNTYGSQILDSRWAKKQGLEDIRRKFRNLLNNAKNFPIQGLAAHIVNRAMIMVSLKFKELGLDAWVALQVHDEITCISRTDQAEQAAKILQECMENAVKLSIPLLAEPLIADNWGDAK